MAEKASAQTADDRLRDMVARLQSLNARAVSSATRLTEGDDVLDVDASGGAVTVTLPSAALGHYAYIRNAAGGNAVTIAAAGSETINGASSIALQNAGDAALVVPLTPSTWGVVAAYLPTPAGNAPTTVVLAADATANATDTLGDITGLSFAVAAGKKYAFEFYVLVVHSVGGLGYKLALTCPSGATLSAHVLIPTTSGSTDAMVEGIITSSGGQVAASSIVGSSAVLVRVSGVLVTDANAGTLQVRHAMGSAGAASVTPKAGSSGVLFTMA